MRILIVSQYFWPENFRINDLVEELTRRGHRVTVLTGPPNYPEGKIFPDYRAQPGCFARFGEAAIVRVPLFPRGTSSLRLILNYLSFAVSASVMGTFRLRGQRFDAIFVFQTSPITAALPAVLLRRLKRAPLLLWVLDLWPDTLSAVGVVKSDAILALVGRLVRFVYRRSDRILVQSRAFAAKIAALLGDSSRTRYFPGWAEAVFERGGQDPVAAPELSPYAEDFKVLFAGNVGEAQDFPAILDAVSTLSQVSGLRWIIVGDGRAAPMVREEINRRNLGDKIVMLGRHPIERMPEFFAAADALLVTLCAEPIWSMTIPGKVQSYLASGKPLLAMLDGEGARVIEEAGAGLVAPAGDGHALAARVVELMSLGSKDRSAMGLAGRRFGAKEFDRLKLVDKLEGWIAECRGDGLDRPRQRATKD